MADSRYQELFVLSAGSIGYLSVSATSDFGASVAEECLLGPLFTDDPRHLKRFPEWRLDLTARSASSLTVSLSQNRGSSTSESKALALSASSYYATSLLTFDVEGYDVQMRLQSTNGSWQLARYHTRSESVGR